MFYVFNWKRLNEFYENSTKADHRNGICKDCQKKVNQKINNLQHEQREF